MTAIIALAIGFAVGLGYFGGLWWTIGFASGSRRPGALLLVSHVIRSAVVAAFLVAAARSGPMELPATLCGLLLARGALLVRLGRVGRDWA